MYSCSILLTETSLDEINIQESSIDQNIHYTYFFFVNNWFISNQPSDDKLLNNFQGSTDFY